MKNALGQSGVAGKRHRMDDIFKNAPLAVIAFIVMLAYADAFAL